MAAANKTVWGIHTMDDPLFLNQNLIAIGWEEMGNLSAINTSRDAYKEKYIAVYPDAKKGSIATSAGMLYRFVHEVQEGDYVVFPSKIDRMMRISLTTQKAIPEYIIKYLNSVIGVQELRKNAKQAVNQASINQQDVKNVAIKLPKLEEQAEIVRIVDDLLVREQQAKEAAEGVLEKIDLIKKAILARAFRGELGTNDPSEESAVGLLKTCYCGKLQS